MTTDLLAAPDAAEATPLDAFGERIEAGSDRPFLVEGETVWLVRAGQVDVFAVRLAGGRPVGNRTHLFRVGQGQPLFGVGPRPAGGGWGLLAVGTSGAKLLRLDRAHIRELARQPRYAGGAAVLIESWVEALCGGIAREVVPSACAELDLVSEVAVSPRASVRPRRRVAWVRHLEGHSLLLGKEPLKVNGQGFLPLSHRAWVETGGPSRLVVADTQTLLGEGEVWAGLDRLHDLALRSVALMVAEATEAERRRLRHKTAALRTALRSACARLADTLEATGGHRLPRRAGDAGADGAGAQDALLAACQLVGDALGITIETPRAPTGAPLLRNPLAAIARASRIRIRQVVLRDGWWREDNGPLLAYRAEDRHPVALLVRPGRGYTLHDPARGTATRVTPAVAESLAPFGHALYRVFPEVSLSIQDVVRFGFRGRSGDLWTVVLATLAASLLGMVPSVATGVVFNHFIPGALRSPLLQMTLVLLVCAAAVALFEVTRSVALLRIEGLMSNDVQAAVWDRLLSLPMSFFRPYTAGDLAVRAMGIDAIRQVISGSTITALVSGITSLGNFLLLFHYSSRLAWWATLLLVIALAVSGLGAWRQLAYQRDVAAVRSKISGLVLQLLSSITKLRVAGAEIHAFAHWAERFSDQRRLQYRARTIGNGVATFNAAFPTAAYILIFWAALPLIVTGHVLRTGDFLAFMSAFGVCLAGVVATSTAVLSTLLTVPLYELAKPILMTGPEVDGDKADPGVLMGDIEVQHAMFRYQVDGPLVLRDLTVHAAPGEFVALVGPSGSGKSTILRLLLGFETLEAGSIYYDGREIGGLDIRAVRRQLGVVLQSGRLMSGDIFTNIAGSSAVSLEDAWDAARMAGFADDIRRMPMGMHTVISEGGGTLSGGQRQRLLIARALVHRPRIVFFDEATSALDNRTQAIVSDSLKRLEATRIVIAHRLSTIEHADRICVVHQGRIVQHGTYEDLMRTGGLFADLARRQLA